MDRRNKAAMQLGQRSRELSPFTTVRRMMEDMDRLFGGYGWGDLGLSTLDDESRLLGVGELEGWNPQVEVFQRGENLVVRADLPGVESKDVNVEVDDNAITIKGERRTEHEEKKEKEGYFVTERSYGSFERRIPLPPGIDRSASDATFQNGVLEVSLKLPKGAVAPQRIQIRGGAPTQATTPSTLQENRTPNVSSQSNPQTPQQTNPQPESRRNGPAPQSRN